MEFLTAFVVYLASFFMFLFVYMCFSAGFWNDPPFTVLKSPLIGTWNIISLAIPDACKDLGDSFYGYVFEQRNSFFQFHYLLLVVLIYSVLFADILPALIHAYPKENHLFTPMLILIVNAIFFLACSFGDPGDIRPGLKHRMYLDVYEYDNRLYRKRVCQTCGFVKPARSKHCSGCDRCVFKFDHHCVWINNCVGGLNKHYFLGYLVSLCTMLTYIVYNSIRFLMLVIVKNNYLSAHYTDQYGNRQPVTWSVLLQILFVEYPRIMIPLGPLIFLMMLIYLFTMYHLYMACRNETTNERYKKSSKQLDDYNPFDRGCCDNLMETMCPMNFLQTSLTSYDRAILGPQQTESSSAPLCYM